MDRAGSAVLVLAVLLFPFVEPAPLSAQLSRSNAPVHGGVQVLHLADGLQILLRPRGTVETRVTTVVFAGRKDQRASDESTAHLVEHLFFRVRIGGEPILEAHRRLGGRGGAVTGSYTTSYSTTLVLPTATELRALIELELERFRSSFEPGAFESESERVRVEEGSARSDLYVDRLATALFGARAGESSAGAQFDSTTAEVSFDRAVRFRERYYAPGNMLVIVDGGFDPDAVSAWLHSRTSNSGNQSLALVARPGRRGPTGLAARTTLAATAEVGSGSVARWHAAIPAHSLIDPESAVDEILAEYVDALEPSDVAEIKVTSRYEALPTFGMIVFTIDGARDRAAALAAVRRALDQPFRPDVWRATRADVAARWDDPTPSDLISCEAAGDWRACVARREWVEGATAGVVAERLGRARSFVDGTRSFTIDAATAEALERRFASLPVGELPRPVLSQPPLDLAVIEEVSTTRPLGGSGTLTIVPVTSPDSTVRGAWFVSPRRRSTEPVDNTMVELVERLVATGGVLPGGTSLSDTAVALGGEIATRLVPYPPVSSYESFYLMGVPLRPNGAVGIDFQFSVPARSLEGLLDAISTAIWEPTFTGEELEHLAEWQLSASAEYRESPLSAGELEFMRRTSAMHPGEIGFPTSFAQRDSTLRTTSVSAIQALHAELFRGARHRLVVVGSTPERFEAWRGGSPIPDDPPPSVVDLNSADDHVARPDALRLAASPSGAGKLWAGWRLPPALPRSHVAALDVVSALLGTGADGLLQRQLRIDTGLAQEVRVRFQRGARDDVGSRFTITVSAAAEDIDAVLERIRGTLERLRTKGPDDAEVSAATARLRESDRRSRRDGGGLAELLAHSTVRDALEIREAWSTVTAEDVRMVIGRWLTDSGLHLVLVADP